MEGLELAETVEALRAELARAAAGAEAEFQFAVAGVQLEFHVAVTRTGEGRAGVKFWVVELGGAGSYARAETARLPAGDDQADGITSSVTCCSSVYELCELSRVAGGPR